jgi:phosphoribosyl 1,2-cyclic phosphate phosphodiesterase
MSITITMLGCGSSSGTPIVGCDCAVCRSDHPRNKRLRVSVLVETEGKRLLIDTSPDLREQSIRFGIQTIDAVLYTHDHADHTHGIDEVRQFNVKKGDSINAYADAHTLECLKSRFPYVFQGKPEKVWYRPALNGIVIPTEPTADFLAEGVRVTPILQKHANSPTLGFRIGNFAYCTDVREFPEASFAQLEGLDVWIVDCLRYTPSYTHSQLDITLGWISKLKPKLAVLTHMAHDFDYEHLSTELPTGVVPGHDGLVLHSS